MAIHEYLNKQAPERKQLLSDIHKIISETNPKANAKIGKMMGKEMILYEVEGAFTYALSSMRGYMSLHNMIMYGHAPVYSKYSKILNKAKFQKGCVNFKNAEEMPLDTLKEFMSECEKASPKYLEMYKARMSKLKK
jgi:hypothetical protein